MIEEEQRQSNNRMQAAAQQAAADRERQQQMAYVHYAQVERSLGSISKNSQKIAETAALYSAIE